MDSGVRVRHVPEWVNLTHFELPSTGQSESRRVEMQTAEYARTLRHMNKYWNPNFEHDWTRFRHF